MKQNNAYRKSLLVLAFSFIAMTGAFAQDEAINKGAWLVGSSSQLGWTNSSVTGGGSSSNFYIAAGAGYFFMDNLAAGLNFGLSSGSGNTTTSIGPFVRYYIGGKWFLGAGFQSNNNGSTTTSQIPFEAGAALFITDNIAVEPSVNFTTFDGGSDLGIRVGFSLYLNRN